MGGWGEGGVMIGTNKCKAARRVPRSAPLDADLSLLRNLRDFARNRQHTVNPP
jgi:hypothetical protein